jgi:nucleoside-diphosphate-sugar epimerase
MEKSKREIQNTTVCVIGGCGFLGSHLVNHLIEDRNCDVIVLDNLITGHKKYLHPKAKFIYCDITASEGVLYKIFKENNVRYVFNYAAEPYIPVSFERPLHTFSINAMGALMVLNAAQEAGVEGILQVSSAEIYGDANGKVNEDEPVRPHSTYGAAKAVIDALVQIRWKEAKTPAIAMRQFNCVGERETHPYVIPEIISQIDIHKKLLFELESPQKDKYKLAPLLLGNNSFRDFQYAGDAVRMAVELLEKGQFGQVYNMGSEEGIKIYDLAENISKIMGFEGVSIIQDKDRVRPWEIWHLQSDNTKLYSVIDYRPKISLDEALRRTIDFYYQNNGWDFV